MAAGAGAGAQRELTMSEALNEALHEEMERDPGVFVVGEDIAQLGGLFQVTKGLLDRFGPQRVIDAPISEAAQAGAGVGAALVGCRPVVELQIADFVSLVMDQVVNHAGKWRYMSGGRVTVPFVLRGAVSSGIGMAAQHSQTLESWFVHAPGLVVIMPSTPYDAKGLLKSAIRDDNPVVFLEKRLLYSRKGPVPEEEYTVPVGVADVKREGGDVTVATYAAGVHLALQAARGFARDGIEVEVVDLRTLKPLDVETLVGSVRKTGRLVVVTEAARAGSFASEVVARVTDEAFDALRSAPVRVTAEDVPMPYAAPLERAVLPQVEDVVAGINAALERRRGRGGAGVTRVEQVQQAMGEQGVDAVFLRLPENVMLTTGWWVQIGGMGIVVVPREGEATLLLPEYEAAEVAAYWPGDVRTFPAIRFDGPLPATEIPRLLGELAAEHGLEGGAIGYEGSYEAAAPAQIDGEPNAVAAPTMALIRSAFSTDSLVDVTAMLEPIKSRKTEHDLEKLRVTNEIARFGLDAFKEHSVAGRTEAEIAAEVGAAIVARGHGYEGTRVVRAYPTVWSGPETAVGWQYFRSRDRRVEQNDVVMLELGTAADGYWADHTRTVVAGKASDRQHEAMAAVFAAQEAAFAAARPGATGGEVDAASRVACAAAGFEQFPHHTGHGVGFRYHESLPWLTKGSEHVLEAGMTIVTEPGVYEERLGGFRWEDNAVVTDGGALRLVETDYGLD